MVKNLRLLREEKGISQQKLADMLNISQQAIFKYEKTANEPDISTLIKLSEIFDVSVDYLIGNTEIRKQTDKADSVLLTEQEYTHIKEWRLLPQNIKNSIDTLISSIHNPDKFILGATFSGSPTLAIIYRPDVTSALSKL